MLSLLNKYHRKDDGFTLVELLIVVLIIGILAAIAIPVYIGIQTQAKHSAVKSDVNVTVKQVQVGLTEGAVTIPTTASSTPIAGYSDNGARSDGDTVITTPLGNGDFQVQGTGADGYTYTYSSVTGQFTEGTSSGTSFGGGSGTAPAITSATPPATATVGTGYSYTVVANGTPAPTFSATGLPTGLGINLTSGLISGTPTTAGTYNYTITVSNNVGNPATQSGTIVVSAGSTTPTFTSAAINSSTTQFANYSYQVSTTGTPAPNYSISAGALPAGVTINSGTGLISGTPTASGTFNFTIKADNGVGTAPTQNGTITVGAAAAMYSTSGSGFDQTWSSGNAGASTSVSYNTSGMLLSVNSTTANAVAYKNITGFVVGGTYQISMTIQSYGGTGYDNQSGPGYSTTASTYGPDSSNLVQKNTTSYTVTYSFSPTTTTVRMWAVIGNYYGNVSSGYVTAYSVIRTN